MGEGEGASEESDKLVSTAEFLQGARWISMIIMRLSSVLLLVMACAGCNTRREGGSSGPQRLTPSNAAAVEEAVRTFTATVAHEVTQEGPLAWSRHFDDSPAFFMAVNGQMAFPSGSAAKSGIQNVALTLKHIELKWGDDLRIDPLTPELAIVAAPWREIQIDSAGRRVEESGFFTGLAEFQDGHWQFRDAHWSSPVSASPAH